MTLSTIGVLCQLGATVRLRDELERWLPGFLAGDEEPVDDAAGGAVVGSAGVTVDGSAVGAVEDIAAEGAASAGTSEGVSAAEA